MFNFEQTKMSIIAFNNNNQDELFKYYDNRNKCRLNKLSGKAQITKKLTVSLIQVANQCENVLGRVKKAGMISDEHQVRVQEKQKLYDDMINDFTEQQN